MTGITMYDTVLNGQFPPGADAYAAYVDGGVGDQPNYMFIRSAFPRAHHLSITIAGNDADCADVESGAMSPADIPAWYARQVTRGVSRPVIYASVSAMESLVRPVIAALPGARAAVRLWTAHYGSALGPHICGPSTCGELGIDADGTQWTDRALGRTLDQSLLRGDFFGPAPALNWTEALVNKLPVISTSSKDVHAVRRVQALVNADREDRGIAPIAEDGEFGPVTGGALRQAQEWAGIAADGIAGPATWAALLGVA